MDLSGTFTPLLILVTLAAVVPILLYRFKQLSVPIVVGEIVAGVIIGRSGFGLVPSDHVVINFLAEFGLVFLMFLSGMEVDFSNLGSFQVRQRNGQGRGWGPVQLGILSFVLTLVVSGVISVWLMRLGLIQSVWMMALILSTTSLGVVLPVLKENGYIGNRYGQSLLMAALIADFATMLLITIYVAVRSQGPTLDVLLILILFAVFFAFYHFGMVFFSRVKAVRRIMEELSHATAQIKVRIAIAIMLMFVVLSENLGTEIILGAFLAGAMLSLLRTPDDNRTISQLESIGFGFLIPIFFIKVGVDFNLPALFASRESIVLLPLLLLAALLVKVLPALIFRFAFSLKESLAAGILLSARLSLIIAASAIGTRLGVISDTVNSAIILVAIFTVTLTPMIFSHVIPRQEKSRRRSVIVFGMSALGLQVAQQLKDHGEKVLTIDPDSNQVETARRHGFKSNVFFLQNPEAEVAEWLQESNTLICTHEDSDLCYRVCLVARKTYDIRHLVVRVQDPNDLLRFEQLGVNTMNAALDSAAVLVMLARNPATYSLLTRTDDNKDVREVNIGCCRYVGMALKDLRLPGDVLVLALRRGGELLVPHGNTKLEQGDYLTLVGSLECVSTAQQMFNE